MTQTKNERQKMEGQQSPERTELNSPSAETGVYEA